MEALFAPGSVTALMGSSGAGKTTLMDVIAGRKTAGRVSGDILVNGHRLESTSFARISGYPCGTDRHSSPYADGERLLLSRTFLLLLLLSVLP